MVVEALNGNGAAYVANTSLPQSKQDIGKSLLKAALVLQLVILGLFIMLAVVFQRKCVRAGIFPRNLKLVLLTLYISSALIGIRTIYRTVEYFTTSHLNFHEGLDANTLSPILRYEWFFWVFEGVLMVLNTFLLNARHPMRFLPRDNKVYLAEDGHTEIKGPGYLDQRNFLVTLFDPFDLAGLFKGKDANKKFWETHEHGAALETVKKDGDVESRGN